MEGVKQFKDITLVYYAPSGASLEIETDLPGDAMSVRRTIALPAVTADRKSDTFPLEQTGALLEGKLIQFRVTSAGTVILYEGSIRFRPVGEYIDGAGSEIWETQPLSF